MMELSYGIAISVLTAVVFTWGCSFTKLLRSTAWSKQSLPDAKTFTTTLHNLRSSLTRIHGLPCGRYAENKKTHLAECLWQGTKGTGSSRSLSALDILLTPILGLHLLTQAMLWQPHGKDDPELIVTHSHSNPLTNS
ncbi:hypothetical protein CB0940_11217 [Cercospora beticola]|uniref:Uncharacterized protein n=1 Tax=Cercospora beticola TaxID=122368 RepID=A0A2G5HDS0_CERBT|nr:hypothetical protein CB0940_11217 [Cercospora beticola]PIA90645.1 hypothetical protein CB0940_11217 [Cercospora beticola]